jgi:diguanylate cyclase (GGDEF)-like protein
VSERRAGPEFIITGIAALLAIVVALLLPVAHFASSYRDLDTQLEGHAALLSNAVSRLVSEQPAAWKYYSHMDELLRRSFSHHDGHAIVALVLEPDGVVIAQTGPPLASRAVRAEAPLFDSGSRVGTVRVEHELRPLLAKTGLAAALGLALGAAIFWSLRTFPLRTLRRTLDELHAARGVAESRARELELQANESALATRMTEVLQLARSVEEADEMIGRTAEKLFAGDPGALYLFTESRTLLNVAAAWGGHADAGSFMPEECWAVRRGQAHLARRGELNPMCAHVDASVDSHLCVPLMAQGEMLGILHLGCAPQDAGHEARQALAKRLAGHLGLALGNLRLRESLKNLSIRDPLTGLFNRRYLVETLEREFYRARRAAAPLAIIMIDADHFKRFNDTFGHEAGDAVLRELGAFLKSSVRAEDIACRYGGEEFCLVLPQMSRDGARERAEAIRQGVARLDIKSGGKALGPVTLSLGVASYPDDADTGEAVLASADAALYQAKQRGRNRVCVFGEPAAAETLRS